MGGGMGMGGMGGRGASYGMTSAHADDWIHGLMEAQTARDSRTASSCPSPRSHRIPHILAT